MLKRNTQTLILLILSFFYIMPVYAEEVDNTDYFKLTPEFVVNLQTNGPGVRFLQVQVQVLGTPGAIEQVQTHNAPIRDTIIINLSKQSRESVNTPKKKKALQEKIQADVERVLIELTGKKQIEGLYFTKFVIQ